ncbi:ABC transporter permease subunit [Rhizobiales bacterium L72]|uniref:ABC transporter permease subunit n=1 Tax=Propylenella binzhouense TaxID=2555902 RepID=A0A964T7M7_9HYPH|nr:ABC transporter permease subunit [Propylenella binzhouense]
MLRLAPAAIVLLLLGPVAAGLGGVLLPAFGYLPVLGGDSLSVEPFRRLFELPGLAASVLLSLGTGLAATAIAVSAVLLFVGGSFGTRTFRLMQRFVSPLLSVPHAAAAFALAVLIAPAGLPARLLSPWLTGWTHPPDILVVHDRAGIAMVLGLVAKEIPFLLLMTLAALPQTMARERTELMASLGYGRVLGFAHGVVPVLYRQLRLPVFAVLAYATSNVDVALVLGPTTPAPLAVRIVELHADPDLAMRFVLAAGAVLQLGVTGAALLLWLGIERFAALVLAALAPTGWRASRDAAARLAGSALVALPAGAILLGTAGLALWSVAGPWRFPDALPARVTLGVWMRVMPGLSAALGNALAIGVCASALALLLVVAALENEVRNGHPPGFRGLAALYLPLLVPQVAFLFGFDFLLARAGWDGRFAALLMAHLVFVLPYVYLSLSGPWRSLDPRYARVLASLGRGPGTAFRRLRLPMLARPILTAFAVGFAVSVGLYLPTLVVGAGRWPTVTTEAVALAAGGDRRIVGVTALVQALLPFLGFFVALAVPAWLHRNRRGLRVAR